MNSFVRFDLSSASENLTDRAQRIATADEPTEWANETERIIMQMRSRTLHASNTIPNRTLTIPCWERCKRKQFFMCVCLCIFTCWAVLIAVNVFIAHIQQQLLGSKPMRWYEKKQQLQQHGQNKEAAAAPPPAEQSVRSEIECEKWDKSWIKRLKCVLLLLVFFWAQYDSILMPCFKPETRRYQIWTGMTSTHNPNVSAEELPLNRHIETAN